MKRPVVPHRLADASREPLRILLVAYRFPPQGGGGVQRPAKLAKFWRRAGHKVAVLTSRSTAIRLEDETLLHDVPDDVERIMVADPSVHQRLCQLRQHTNHAVIRRLLQVPLFLTAAVSVPDLVSGWRGPAIRRGRDALETFRPDVIVVTGPPWTSFLVAASLAARAGVPLVLDYRDPWTHTYLRLGSGALARVVNPWIERRILGRARGVVGAHREILRRVQSSITPSTRRLWIPNGSDPDDFPNPAPAPPTDRFVLGYTGGFFHWRSPVALLRVLESLLREGRISPDNFRFRMAGSVKPGLEKIAPDSLLEKVIEVEGYLPHAQSIRVLQSSTVTFVLEADQVGTNHHTPGKFYEVLQVGRPMLLLCPEGITSRLARQIGGCWIAHPDDENAIRKAVLDMIERWELSKPMPQANFHHLRFYDRSHQANRYARFLASLVD